MINCIQKQILRGEENFLSSLACLLIRMSGVLNNVNLKKKYHKNNIFEANLIK